MNRDTNDKAKSLSRELKRRASDYGVDAQQVQAFVEAYPLLSLAVVVAAGYAIGRLMSKL
jgi:ElaB/YqjD/DUF883 family membrane-anchored ribosome-binding protein